MAIEDYSPYGLVKRMVAPKQDYGWGKKSTTSTPLFNFNNSGFQAPTMNASGFTPTLGMGTTKPVVKPASIVATKPKGLVGATPKAKVKTTTQSKSTNSGMPLAPPALVPVAPTVVQTLPKSVGLATNQGYAVDEYGNNVTTSFQRDFEAANPNAVLGADGNWTGLSQIGRSNPTIDDITSNPGAYANYDFSGMDAGSLGVDVPTSSNWIDGLSNYETLQGAAGLGGLAMNAYGMFGSGGTMDVNKKNIELMNQQLENNREEMANRKGFRSDLSKAFGARPTGLGV